ncbi:helix-turn-helix domain-containing protein [Streptomyces caelestis]|uniref:helix-turn-helix domain-containing protein n=1 Tax=Streptomyces caelestis TaxID=36816 RepID=UPI0036FB10E6
MAHVVTTASVPVGQQVTYWQEAMTRTCVPMHISPTVDGPFRAWSTTHQLGCLQITTVEADAVHAHRTRRQIAQGNRDTINISLQKGSSGLVVQDGREALMAPGDLTFYDTTRPYSLRFAEPYGLQVFALPRQALGLSEEEVRRLTAVAMRPDEGLAALVASFLVRLASDAADYLPQTGDVLARNAVDLLTTLAAERLGRGLATGDDSATTALRLRVHAFIDRHLSDPDLSPGTVAAAHHVSVRYLHYLFQEQGTTVSRWIRHRRLEACRRELARRATGGVAVAAVAQRFGFTSPAHFSRVFRAAYGMSPREWRAVAAGAPDPGQAD